MSEQLKPAFPLQVKIVQADSSARLFESSGLTKLEYFAAKALQGLLADSNFAPAPQSPYEGEDYEWSGIANAAVLAAKATIRRLEKEQ